MENGLLKPYQIHGKMKPKPYLNVKYGVGNRMRKNLLVSGCSFTNHDPESDGVNSRWYHYIADKLDMDTINLARNGSGNEYIFTSIFNYLETDAVKPDMIIAAWSKSQRRDYQYDGRWMNDRVDLRGDLRYHLRKTARYKRMLELLCNHYDIRYVSLQMLELGENEEGSPRISVQDKVLRWNTGDMISKTDHHPSEIGHEKIGKYVYENYL